MTLTQISADPPDDADSLSALIQQARERVGMRQTDLAAGVHASLSAVSSWERGTHAPPAEKILALAEALGVRFVADPSGQWRLEDRPPAAAGPVIVVVSSAGEAVEVVRRIQSGLDTT